MTALATYRSFIRGFGYGDLLAHGIDIAYSTCTRRLHAGTAAHLTPFGQGKSG